MKPPLRMTQAYKNLFYDSVVLEEQWEKMLVFFLCHRLCTKHGW
jgi:hypothetical protein